MNFNCNNESLYGKTNIPLNVLLSFNIYTLTDLYENHLKTSYLDKRTYNLICSLRGLYIVDDFLSKKGEF